MTTPSTRTKRRRLLTSDLRKSIRAANESRYDYEHALHFREGQPRDPTILGGVIHSQHHHRRATSSSATSYSAAAQQVDYDVMDDDVNVECEEEEYRSSLRVALTQNEHYTLLVKQNKALHSLNDALTSFTIQDYDGCRSILKTNSYIVIARRAINFCGSCHWMYTCSCDSRRGDMIACCDGNLQTQLSDFLNRFPPCVHTNVVESIMESVDAVNDIDPTVEPYDDHITALDDENYDTQAVQELSPFIHSVKTKDGYGIIEVYGLVVKCLTCHSTLASPCSHISTYRSMTGDDTNPIELMLSQASTTTSTLQCLSSNAIPYESSRSMQRTYQLPLSQRFRHGEDGVIEFEPDVTSCSECEAMVIRQLVSDSANLFLLTQILSVRVYRKECVSCRLVHHYDGINDCVLNMGNFVVAHEVLRRYMFTFLMGRSTIYTDYVILSRQYKDYGFHHQFRYQDFISSWYGFFNLLDIDYKDGFRCPTCGTTPDTIVMDATCLSFRKSLISWQSVLESEMSQSRGEACDASTDYSNRIGGRTLFTKTIRSSLMNFANARKGISEERREEIVMAVAEDTDQPLADLISHIFSHCHVCSTKHDFIHSGPEWRDLLLAFASSNPLCSFIRPSQEFFDFLSQSLAMGETLFQNDRALGRLQTDIPILFNLLLIRKNSFPFDLLSACLPLFHAKVFHPFSAPQCVSDNAPPSLNVPFSYFPQLPPVRARGLFLADQKNVRKDDICTKMSAGHPTLLPGVFTIFCAHGVCYGFDIMRFHESPDVPFTLLRTRFTKPPQLVIYDNACSLHAYCLNRDAALFRETTFRVDALHYKNHTGDLANAIRTNSDMHFGLYHSLFEWFNPLYLADKANGFKTQDFVRMKTMPELYDLVHRYKPEVIWSDGQWETSDKYWNATEFLAWLYNDSPVRDIVATNDRWGSNTICKHGGYYTCNDRYNPGHLIKHKWENALTLDKYAWGFRRKLDVSDVLTMKEVIYQLVSTVSCGGNMLLNVGPTREGTIAPIFQERLSQIGSWLKVNGEAIYSTRPWIYQNDTITPGVWYTMKKNAQEYFDVYAIVLDWPTGNNLTLGAPISSKHTSIHLLGYEHDFKFVGGVNLVIEIPPIAFNKMPCEWGWVFKLSGLVNQKSNSKTNLRVDPMTEEYEIM